MSVVSQHMAQSISQGSMIRRMFDAGIELKRKFGAENVFDFSLGNPDLPPPPVVAQAMRDLADHLSEPASLGYMPNAGFPWALDKLAAWLSEQQGVTLTRSEVMLSCGAAGALNAFLHTVLEPEDEVISFAPCFVEYGFYTANHGGVFKTVPARGEDFGPDFDALGEAIGPKTRVVLINSPNNPTGAVYSAEDMQTLARMLADASHFHGRPIYLVCDEPYRFLAYDGLTVPPALPLGPYTVVIGSFSKNYGLAGERIGYVAISPDLEDKATLMAGLILSNRTLGFVNPPVVGQYLMAAALGSNTDEALAIYAKRRDMMAKVLSDAHIEYIMPKGAFYFFPKAPGGDDQAFVDKLTQQNILGVPGRGFGLPGYFRLCFAVEDEIIERSAEGFKKANS